MKKVRRRDAYGEPVGFLVFDPKVKAPVSSPEGMDLDELEEWLRRR